MSRGSAVGTGALFCVRLQLPVERAVEKPTSNVLVVDDNAINRAVAKGQLEHLGVSVASERPRALQCLASPCQLASSFT